MSDSTTGTVVGSRYAYDGGRNATYSFNSSDAKFNTTEVFTIYKADQEVVLQIPGYFDTMVVSKVVADGEDVVIPPDPTLKTNWYYTELDTQAMSKAYTLWNDPDEKFTGKLIRTLKFKIFTATTTAPIAIKVSYNRFYMDLYEYNNFDGVGPAYSPSLGKYMLDKLSELEANVRASFKNTFSRHSVSNELLEEDLNAAKNWIQYESHAVKINETQTINTIMPAYGSFYTKNLELFYYPESSKVPITLDETSARAILGCLFVSTDLDGLEAHQIGSTLDSLKTEIRVILTEENYRDYLGMSGYYIDVRPGSTSVTKLVLDSDYEFTHINLAKTERALCGYGVYDGIRLLTPIDGYVLVNYFAYGGAVVLEDVRNLKKDIANTMNVLSNNKLLNANSLEHQPVIRDMLARIAVIEQFHHHFGRVEHEVFIGKTGFHWFNIAELYDVAYGEDLGIVDEIGTFRIESMLRKWSYEFTLSVDLKQALINALHCKTLATSDISVNEFKNYIIYAEQRDDVAIRVCWNGDGQRSGLMLQLGWNFDNYKPNTDTGIDTDTIIVSNKSGVTSKWKLVYNPLDLSYESDSSTRIFDHTIYVRTTDTTYQENKTYYKFENRYTYFITVATYAKAGVDYFTLETDPTTGEKIYVKATVVPGQKLEGKVYYERALFDKIAVKQTVTPGVPILDEVYEVKEAGYDDSYTFTLPNDQMQWSVSDPNSKQIKRLLEPINGLLLWAGNLPVHVHNAKSVDLYSDLSDPVFEVFEVSSIKSATIRFFDRKLGMTVSRNVPVSFDPETGYANGQVVIDLPDLCGADILFKKDTTNKKFVVTFLPYVGTDSRLNARFDLRQINLHL